MEQALKRENTPTAAPLWHFQDAEVPTGLYDAVLARIVAWERRGALLRAAGLGCVAVLSVVGFLQALSYAADELYLSGFAEYARLFFTDHDVVSASRQEFASSLIESLPAVPLILLCGALLLLVWSTARAARDVRIARGRPAIAAIAA